MRTHDAMRAPQVPPSPWTADTLFTAVESLETKLERRHGPGHITLSWAEALFLRRVVRDLARLAATKPQFNNPIATWTAQAVRDRVLASLEPAKVAAAEEKIACGG
jgi:hypothetical protein